MHEDPAATPEEQEQVPERLPESLAAEGAGHEDDELPGDEPPAEPMPDS